MRSIISATLAIAVLAVPAAASPCREKGKFVKCKTVVKKTAVRCRANGKFAACGTKGAKPV